MWRFGDYLSRSWQQKSRPLCCGDLNVAHQAMDLARPKANYNKTPGYTQDEIDGMGAFGWSAGFDGRLARTRNPERVQYSWWSYPRGSSREKNVGWRLDYFMASADTALARCGPCEIHTLTCWDQTIVRSVGLEFNWTPPALLGFLRRLRIRAHQSARLPWALLNT